MARFTIGIPTFNRANMLRRAISSALDQTYPNVEVVVSDNASTDDTANVVRSFGDRVGYHRFHANMGSRANFIKLTELATGEFFSWLQDDDLIFADFAYRAAAGLTQPGVTAYAAYAAMARSLDTVIYSTLMGPPISLDWSHSKARRIAGIVPAALSLFASFGIPPTVAFRTSAIRASIGRLRADCELFNERIAFSFAAHLGDVIVDPWVAGVYLQHQGISQYSAILAAEAGAVEAQYAILASEISSLLNSLPANDLRSILSQYLAEIPGVTLRGMLELFRSLDISSDPSDPIALIRKAALDNIPPELRDEFWAKPHLPTGAGCMAQRIWRQILRMVHDAARHLTRSTCCSREDTIRR